MKIKTILVFLTIALLTVGIFLPVNMEAKSISTSSVSVRYRAVLASVSYYPPDVTDLTSNVKDVEEMRDILLNGDNWNLNYIKMIKDEEVTVDRVRTELDWLKNSADPNGNDVSFFYYSGHGKRVNVYDDEGSHNSAREGNEIHDECLRLYDDILLDDEFTDRIADIPGKVVVVLDSCYSAGFFGDLEYKIEHSSGTYNIAIFSAHLENQALSGWPLLESSFLSFHIRGGLATDADKPPEPAGEITAKDCYDAVKSVYERGQSLLPIVKDRGINLNYTSYTAINTPLITGFTNTRPSNPYIEIVENKNLYCTIETSVTDDHNNVELFVSWGDGEGGWSGPYDSGETIALSHTYGEADDYKIVTIARDSHGSISNWISKDIAIKSKQKTLFSFINLDRCEFLKRIFSNLIDRKIDKDIMLEIL